MVSVEPPPEELLFPEPVSRAEFQRTQNSLGQLDSEKVDCQVRKTNLKYLHVQCGKMVACEALLNSCQALFCSHSSTFSFHRTCRLVKNILRVPFPFDRLQRNRSPSRTYHDYRHVFSER